MTYKLVFLTPAINDLRYAANWLETIRPGLGRAFREDLRAVCERIQRNPEMYQAFRRDHRRAILHRFDYALTYRLRSGVIEVIGIFHCRLHPATLQNRSISKN